MARSSVLLLLCGVLSFIPDICGQENTSYSNRRLLAQLHSHIPLWQDGAVLRIEQNGVSKILVGLGVERLVRLTGRTTGSVYEEPVLLEFSREIEVYRTIEALMKTGVFEYVEPDFQLHAGGVCSIEPDDFYYFRQWSLMNDGTFNANSVEDADIDMDHAWTIATGNPSVVVSIIDTGVKTDHPEFSGRIWNNPTETAANGLDDDSNGYIDDIIGWDFVNNDNNPTDDHGHGTNVTGIIGAIGQNTIGYAGVDWNCKLMICKVLDGNNSGFYSWWISAMYYSVDNGADVINASLGGLSFSSSMQTAVNYAFSHNVPIVASMMNANNNTPYYPAAYANSIAIGATDTDNTRVNPFFWGGGSCYGSHIELVAPGNYIYGLNYLSNTNYNSNWGGTSQAAPLVTGVIAILKSIDPEITVAGIRTLLYNGAVDLVGDPTEDTPGWDQYHGHGVLNAYNTIVLATASRVASTCSYTWGNTTLTNSGIYLDTISTGSGCDSVAALNLLVLDFDDKMFVAGVPLQGAANYQWQTDAGSGFSDLQNNLVYSGVNTDTLMLLNAPLNWSGHNYRCVILNAGDTIITEAMTLRFGLSWDGSQDTTWENPENWDCLLIPGAFTDVSVNSASNQPIVNSMAQCRALELDTGAVVKINTGFVLNISGDQ